MSSIDDADILAEIAANPDDDQPRLVYADLLQQRGDPRGEFIALQLAGREPARTAELLDAYIFDWLRPIARFADTKWCTFERGFVTEVTLLGVNNAILAPVVGHPIWATVRLLRMGVSRLPDDLPVDLLRHPVMQRLEHVAVSTPEGLRWVGIEDDGATYGFRFYGIGAKRQPFRRSAQQ